MRSRTLMLGLALSTAWAAGCAAPRTGTPPAGPGAAVGTAAGDSVVVVIRVTYRERMALPPDAQVSLQVADVSRADAPAAVVWRESRRAGGAQVPFEFRVAVARHLVDPEARYGASARIEIEGRPAFVTDVTHPVNLVNPPSYDVLLLIARQVPREP